MSQALPDIVASSQTPYGPAARLPGRPGRTVRPTGTNQGRLAIKTSLDSPSTSVDVRRRRPSVGIMRDQAAWASEIAHDFLERPLPRRWAHTQGVARQARSLAPMLGDHADLIEAAAWLHDIGYSPAVDVTGFHPLDGARYLRDFHQTDERICRLVANHSCAILEAQQRNLGHVLAREFPPANRSLQDALTYCDMTTTPDGDPVAVASRLAEIRERYGPDHLVTRFIRRAEPQLVGAVKHVQNRARMSAATAENGSPYAPSIGNDA